MQNQSLDNCVRTTCPYCGVGCGVDVKADPEGGFKVSGTASHPANQSRLCVKGAALHETLDTSTRLLNPQIGGETASWEDALDTTARKFREIINEHGPDAVAFYVSGQLLTEDYYVANKLMKGFIGSANIDTNSRLCMSSAVAGYKRAFGSDTVPCDYTDLEEADLIVLAGSNTAWAHPVVYQRLVAAKRKRPNMRIVSIDPRRTSTADICDLHLAIKPNSDAALFSGLLHYLNQNGCFDQDFIGDHTKGLVKTLVAAEKLASNIDTLAEITGLTTDELLTFFQLFAKNEKTVTLYSQGLNQSANGTDNANAVINVHLATGRIGKRGTGPFSMTGQPNAMGGREVGGLANQLAAHMDFADKEAVERVRWFWKSNNIATEPGLKAVDLFEAVSSGKVRAVWVMGTNPAVSMPQAERVTRALKACEFLVVSDCEAKTDTTECADVLLPALAWGEKSGTVTNSERCISRQRNFLPPTGNAKADWWIVSQVGQRLGYRAAFNYTSSAQIFREHAKLSAYENNGTRDFDIGALSDLSDEEYDQLQPTQWPCPSDKEAVRLYSDGRFYTADKRANFVPLTPTLPTENTASFPYTLNSGRLRDQWHTMTRTAKSPRLLQHTDEPYIEIHPVDAAREGVTEGQLLSLQAVRGSSYIAKAKISDRQRPHSLFVPIHWNKQFSPSAKASSLSTSLADPVSGQPAFKHTKASLQIIDVQWQACVMSRQEGSTPDSLYWCKIPQGEIQRIELSGEAPIEDTEQWLKKISGAEGSWMTYHDKKIGTFRAACIADGKLVAVVYYTEQGTLPERSGLAALFEVELSPNNCRSILAGKLVDGGQDSGPIICACHATGEKSIRGAIEEAGCDSAYALGEKLGCGTGCGSCLPELNAILTQYEVDRA